MGIRGATIGGVGAINLLTNPLDPPSNHQHYKPRFLTYLQYRVPHKGPKMMSAVL